MKHDAQDNGEAVEERIKHVEDYEDVEEKFKQAGNDDHA